MKPAGGFGAFATGVACAALALGVPSAGAQGLRIEPRIAVLLTGTNNGDFGGLDTAPSELQLEISPSAQIRANTARLRIDGTVGLKSTTFLRTEREDRVYPVAYVTAGADIIDRWLYVDTTVSVERSANDVYAPQGIREWISVGQTVYQYRVSPYVSHEFSPRMSFKARSDNVWTRRRSDSELGVASSDSRSRRDTATFDVKPEPFGLLAELADENAGQEPSGGSSALDLTSARVELSYAASPSIRFGVSGGRERAEFLGTAEVDSTFGSRVLYTPSERAKLDVSIERRFFGWGGSVALFLRSPFIAMDLQAERRPVVQASPLLYVGEGQSLLSLLDAAFTTRFPDPAQRSAVVENFVRTYGLPAAVSGSVDVFPDYPQLKTRGSLRVLLIGRLTTATVGLFADRSALLRRDGDPYLLAPFADADSRQIGGSFDVARRLTPLLLMRLGIAAQQAVGLGLREDSFAREIRYTSGLTYTANPRTEFTGGFFIRRYRSDAIPRDREIAAFTGASYRF